MWLGDISFCNHYGFNIKSDDLKKKILNDIEVNFKKKIIQKHHERFNEHSLKNINTNPYMMTLRSNGNPYFLYLTRYNNVNQCIFIDKKIQQGYFYPRMVIVKLWFDDVLFNNTLFDGEMIKDDQNNWIFLIHDIIGDSGKDLMSCNIIKRIDRCYEIFGKMYQPDVHSSVCIFQIKQFFHYHEFDHMINEFMPSLSYSCRGIYFTPLFLKFKEILYNFDNSLVKVVPRQKYKGDNTGFLGVPETSSSSDLDIPKMTSSESESSIGEEKTLFLQKTNHPDVYDVFSLKNDLLGIASINKISTSKMMRHAFANKSLVEKIKFKCTYNSKFDKWTPEELI